MPASRRYTWTVTPDADDDSPHVRGDITSRMHLALGVEVARLPQRYSAPQVSGYTGGIPEFSVTITTDHQWRVDWRARQLLKHLVHATGFPVRWFQLKSITRPEVHRHPNRAARWRGRVSG